ncbi:type VI secretion system membrane subunit TssM [Ramlibacter monticola]|uniref:Type VI secretion system membrane subunit TssM n=1 Tax=Ramlibacter monticola TaxID=1926872 RepID=A0A936Z0V9_9BURK|nr:type VI secretion system membrane subunit TssM [Ramlibacter monticola]MBL0392840.1 type VI secretion system membrane subunit TssM [Ramlibacter monticola]
MIKKLLGLVFNRWLLLALVLLALGVAIWIVGPLVAIAERRPLETESARWIAIASLGVLVVALVAWKRWRAGRGNAAVVNQLLAAAPAGERAEAESADLKAVRQRFEQAMGALQRARFGRGGVLSGWAARLRGRYLYELPWYLIVGAPGSGKTTALHNCGLNFPLAGNGGEQALRGVGGTRNCDWWFTDQAVLIDTAGRFVTQDSDRENDRATWGGFLALLRRARPRQPLNGVLVTVSASDLLARDAGARAHYAATVRERLNELHEHLAIRFPVYVLVTKSDLLAGFVDYFATIDKEQRATPWGATFPLQQAGQAPGRFGPEFDALLQRLSDGLIERLQGERDPRARARIYGFPSQFAALRGALQEFLEAAFAPSTYEPESLLRGFYFISGTQEGTPIDRVLGSIARSYRLERAVLAPNRASGKSYFLNRLMGEVVFAEQGLAGTNLKWERRRRWLAAGAYAAIGVLTVGTLGAWTFSYVNNRRYVDLVAGRAERVRQLVQETPNRATPDLQPLLPALAATRSLAGGQDHVPWTLGSGLYQGRKLESAAHRAYERMLVDAVLPRIGLRIEEQLRLAGAAMDSQYEALKAYLMLHDIQHFDAEALKAYVEADWDAQFGRSLDPQQRAELTAHLDALLAQGPAVSSLPEDRTLVEFHRARLASVQLPLRIYQRMRHRGLGSEFPEFTAVKVAGNNAALVFQRASGLPLTKGVPGLFTYDGYHRGFQKEVTRVTRQLADEQGWVLGVAATPQDPAAAVVASDQLLDDVRRIYLNEYSTVWQAFVADVRLQPMPGLPQAVQMARLLSAPDSPLPPLMKAMSRETTLLAAGGRNVIEKGTDTATDALKKGRKALSDLLAQRKTESGPRIEAIVDDRFAALRRFVTAPEGGKAPLDDTIALIGEVHVLLNAVDSAVKGGAAPPPSPLPNRVKSEAARMPEPVRSMLDNLSQNSGQVAQLLVRQNLGQEVRSQVGEFCQQAVAGRYPLDRASGRDATQADFALLFGPGGKIDQLFQQKLAAYVDTSARPWKFRTVEGIPLGADNGSLPQFQRAQAIRETFFPAGNAPSLRLQFKPVEMDASLRQFILDVDGQVVQYDHGPQIPTTVQWPGPRGSMQVRVQVNPPSTGSTFGAVFEGPWALLRLFDRVKIEPGSVPERFRATFDVDGRKAVFEVTANSVRNPFRLRELSDFACPTGL